MHLYPAISTLKHFTLQMHTITDYQSSIITPEQASCVFDALPLPSPIIDNVIISSDDVIVLNYTNSSEGVGIVRLWVEWKRPSPGVMSYVIRVTETQALEKDDDFGELFAEQMINVSECYLLHSH